MPNNDIQAQEIQDRQHVTQPTLANRQIVCVSPVTFSQKLYQSRALEIAEEYEQAINANSLEKIKDLLNKVLEID